MFAADPGQDRGDVAVLAVKAEPALRIAPGKAGEAPLDRPGPAGEIALAWLRAMERPVSVAALHRGLPQLTAQAIAALLDAGRGGPVARAALVLEAALADRPRDETAALVLAEAALARALGWTHLVPLLAAGLPARALRLTGAALIAECHRAVAASGRAALSLAADLARRAARLEALVPKLRAKGAGAAVALVLSRDAVSPAALAGPMSDRAARRFCDRLVDLGAVRELTGRDAFRLYGL